MIKSFRCKDTQKVFNRKLSRKFVSDFRRVALRKLLLIDAVENLESLNVPPGNRLEALLGARKAEHSIRINQQWRICFVWRDGNAYEVEITDYH